MRVAAIYDIHGNLPALEAVLDELQGHSPDLIVVGGDVAWGPFPRETVDRLQGLNDAVFIRGNADREVAGPADESHGLDEVVAEINRWCWERLRDDQRSWLAQLDDSLVLDVDGLGPTFFCHGSPRSDEEMLTVATPRQRLAAAVHGVVAPTIVCGHTHMQFDQRIGDKRVVNAGSIGLPYEDEPAAYWALLGPDIELRKTFYDVAGALDSMTRSGCPHTEMVFIDTLRQPPSQSEVIRQFEATAEQQTY